MSDWQRFFDGYAGKYDDECFTKNTEAEVAFIIDKMQPGQGARILDIGCGTGRHSVGLAVRGFDVTGVDLSSGMLTVAAKRAEAAGVSVEWVHADAVTFVRPDSFDLVICLCEGAMCLLTADDDALEHDMAILHNILRSLRPGGKLLMNVLNACRTIRAYSDADVAAGKFDPMTLTELSNVSSLMDDGEAPVNVRERGYTPPEFRRMLIAAGFDVQGVYGGTAGNWNLHTLKLDEYELMAMASKPRL